jgi:hypothetical protein
MAYDTETIDTYSEDSTDESGMTDAELKAWEEEQAAKEKELADKAEAIRKAAAAEAEAKQLETVVAAPFAQQPQIAPPTTPNAPPYNLAAPSPAPVVPPQGKIYMGPNISRDQFDKLPEGARVMPPERPMAPYQSPLERAQAVDRPGTRTISVDSMPPSLTSIDPIMQKFGAIQAYNQAIQNGAPRETAAAQFLPDMFTAMQKKAMTANQEATLAVKREGLAQTKDLSAKTLAEREASRKQAKDLAEKKMAGERSKMSEFDSKRLTEAYRLLNDSLTGSANALQETSAAKFDANAKAAQSTIDEIIKKYAGEETTKVLTKSKAEEFKARAGGNRAKAEALARAEGYEF